MKRWKKMICVVLTAALALGLCACNKGGATSGISVKKDNGANVALAKEYVYRLDEFNLEEIQKNYGDCSVIQLEQTEDKIFLIFRAYTKDYSENCYKLASMNKDGSGMEIYDLQTKSVGDEENAAADMHVNTEENGEENTDSMVYEDISFGIFQIAGNHIYANKNYYYEDYRDSEHTVSVQKSYVCSWDMQGNLQKETEIEALAKEDTWFYIVNLSAREDGSVRLLVNGDVSGKITVSPDGTVSDLIPVEQLSTYFEQAAGNTVLPDGKLFLSYYDSSWSKMSVVTYDFETDELSEPYELPTTMSYNGLSNLTVDAAGDLIFSNNQGVFRYHEGDAEPVQVMSFINSDLNISYLDELMFMDEEHFVGIYSVYDDKDYTRTVMGGVFTKVAPEDIPDKEVLVLGGNYVSNDLKQRVVDFNKASNTHRIILKDYSQYNSNEDYMAGYTQLNNDILAGNMPDILQVDSSNISLENYVAKGLLTDIGALIEADEKLSQVDYMENVFEACKIDGKLYEVVPTFNVNTYIGKTSLVGSHSNWTMEEAQALLDKMPDGTSLFGEDTTREGYIRSVMSICGRDFIDVYSGKCNFDSEEFISVMEFAKKLPEKMDDDYYGENWYTNYESQYRENRTILSSCYISAIQYLVYTVNGSFGEDVNFIGMPTSSGQGSVITTNTTYAISAKSAYCDVAWEFLRYYLDEEYQESVDWQLPVNERCFDNLAHKATKNPVSYDNLGNEVEEEYSYWINDENIVLDPFTPAQVSHIKDFIASIKTRDYYNEDIINIITEEMGAFYQGQKSAADVAAIIQSRAQLFVNENR